MTKRKVARLRTRLKGYVEASTKSDFEGYLEVGDYVVLEERKNHPDGATDYFKVEAPTLGASDTWLCGRWTNQKYLEVDEVDVPSEPLSFDADPLAIDEKALTGLLPAFEPYTYDLDDARYPWELPNARVPPAPPQQNNCCTFVEALCVRAFAHEQKGFTWDMHRHRQMMIVSTDDYFSPVTAALKSGMAVPTVSPDAIPNPWTLVQGWRHQWRGGHTFLVLSRHAATDKVLTLESNSEYGLNGVGFRGLGNLRDFASKPPAHWWERPEVWTWQRICSTYRYRQTAALRVKNLAFTSSA